MHERQLIRVRLESALTPEQALLALRNDDRPFALLGRWGGGGAILGSEPLEVAAADSDPLEILDRRPDVGTTDAAAVGGGWFGYLGYGLGALAERLPPAPPRPVATPRSSLCFYDHLLRRDSEGEWWFEALAVPDTRRRLEDRLGLLAERMEGPPPEPEPAECGLFRPRPGEAGYRRAVEECLSYIRAGDLYQANIALRLEAAIDGRGIDLFARAAPSLQPAYAAYLGMGAREIVSLSPELFLRRRGREVASAPIKGTRARPTEPRTAAAQGRALAESSKDLAENVMIVDLVRNDLGRVCEYGSVSAELCHDPEAHPGLWHLVSRVRGTLREGATDAELLRATFPPGSVTGAPKIKAQEVISTLESTAREAYTGAIGYASPLSGLELNVAIRTFEIEGDRIWLGAGAGIVADSDSAAEYAETMAKARPLVAAVGSRIVEEPPTIRQPAPRLVRLPRPDPALGILETLLVCDGRAMELERHLTRLGHSSSDLYGEAPDQRRLSARVEAEAEAATPDGGFARLRILLEPRAGGGLGLQIQSLVLRSDREEGRRAAMLVPCVIPGGLGSHKWIDRRLVDDVAAGSGREALLVDIDGSVLETGAGNLWIAREGELITPPADGRILPGVTRGVVLELAEELGIAVREENPSLAELVAAEEVFLTSSVRGVVAAALADQHLEGCVAKGFEGGGEIQGAMGEALRLRRGAQSLSYSAI